MISIRQHPGSYTSQATSLDSQASHSRNFLHYSCLDTLIIRERVSPTNQISEGSPWSCSLVLPGPNHLKREHQVIEFYGSDEAHSKEPILKDLEPEEELEDWSRKG